MEEEDNHRGLERNRQDSCMTLSRQGRAARSLSSKQSTIPQTPLLQSTWVGVNPRV